MLIFRRLVAATLLLGSVSAASALERVSREPYLSAIVTDAATGAVLFEDNADAPTYPASVTKLMTFAVVMERVNAGQLRLEDRLTVTAEAAHTGGSQVYLKQGEVFTIEEMLYALMVPSANDAAVALAIHVAGSKEAFVELMNAKAREFGMRHTEFHSPHGLPPGRGQLPDVSTARDIALLSRELIRRDSVLRYSSVRLRLLREQSATPFEMRNHNALLAAVPGCDGLKTGYFTAGGFSLAATAEREGRRVIAVVMGSQQRVVRDVKAKELLERGFAAVPAAVAPAGRLEIGGAAPVPTVRTEKAAPAPERAVVPTARPAPAEAPKGGLFRLPPPPQTR